MAGRQHWQAWIEAVVKCMQARLARLARLAKPFNLARYWRVQEVEVEPRMGGGGVGGWFIRLGIFFNFFFVEIKIK